MKILLFGATGRTGKLIIEEALKRGHTISAIARDPEKLKGLSADINIGTPYDYETVEKAILGCDAVISTLNVSRKSDNPWAALASPKDMMSVSVSNAIKAMERSGIKRIVTLGAMGAGRSWKTAPGILKFVISISNLKFAFQDHGKVEEILENSSMDYTVCRAPMLSNEYNKTGAEATAENERPAGKVLSRNSAAEFFIKIIENKEHLREIISLTNKPA